MRLTCSLTCNSGGGRRRVGRLHAPGRLAGGLLRPSWACCDAHARHTWHMRALGSFTRAALCPGLAKKWGLFKKQIRS